MTTTYFSTNILTLESGQTVEFKYNIAEVLEFKNIIIVRLEIPPSKRFNENVYGIKNNGDIAWQIPKIDHVYSDSPYTGMEEKGGKIILYNWDGLNVTIDSLTGDILSQEFGR